MSQPPLTPQQEALAQELLEALRQGADDLLAQIARTLAATTGATLFGDTELKPRAIARAIAARAYELHLRDKETATTGPACPAPAAASPPATTATAAPRRWAPWAPSPWPAPTTPAAVAATASAPSTRAPAWRTAT